MPFHHPGKVQEMGFEPISDARLKLTAYAVLLFLRAPGGNRTLMCLLAPGSLVRCICQFCYRGLMRPEGLEPSLCQETGLKPVVSSVPPRALTYFSFRKSHNRYKIPMMESPFIKYYLQERESNPLSQTGYGPGMVIPFHSPAEPMTGVEPATYCLQGSRTASCATSALIYYLMIFLIRPAGVEPAIAGYKPGATYRITSGAYIFPVVASVFVSSSFFSILFLPNISAKHVVGFEPTHSAWKANVLSTDTIRANSGFCFCIVRSGNFSRLTIERKCLLISIPIVGREGIEPPRSGLQPDTLPSELSSH